MVEIVMLRQEALCYCLVASMGLAPVGPEAAGKTAWEGATSQGIQAASGSWKGHLEPLQTL